MSATAIIMMVLILAFVWGGFILILATAVRKERGKDGDAPGDTALEPTTGEGA